MEENFLPRTSASSNRLGDDVEAVEVLEQGMSEEGFLDLPGTIQRMLLLKKPHNG